MLNTSIPEIEESNVFILIDPNNLDECFRPILTVSKTCVPSMYSGDMHILPALIPADLHEPEMKQILSELMSEQNRPLARPDVCAVVTCPKGIEAATKQIGAGLIIIDGCGMHRLWRFIDPRIFWLIAKEFPSEQVASLLGPIKIWEFPWCGRWWRYENDQVAGTIFENDKYPTVEQVTQLEHCSTVDRIFRIFFGSASEISDAECISMNLKILHNVSQASKRFDLATEHDLLEFSIHFAKFGHDLLNHRKFQRPLSGEMQTARSWSELTQTLGPGDWAELEQSNVNRKRENYDMPTM